MLRFLTAGESHGELLDGDHRGYACRPFDQGNGHRPRSREDGRCGYGRGNRMKIEKDSVKIYTGVRWGRTLGSPVGLMIRNKDWENWRDKMSPDPMFLNSADPLTRPRPGHADLAGALKYGMTDIRNILERSSARETAMRVAVGAVAKRLLEEFGIEVMSHVLSIGGVYAKVPKVSPAGTEKTRRGVGTALH